MLGKEASLWIKDPSQGRKLFQLNQQKSTLSKSGRDYLKMFWKNKDWYSVPSLWLFKAVMVEIEQWYNDQAFKYVRSRVWIDKQKGISTTLLANNSQHCWMLHDVSVCIPCCMLLCVFGSWCAKFETSQTFSPVQTDTTLLGVVESVCM